MVHRDEEWLSVTDPLQDSTTGATGFRGRAPRQPLAVRHNRIAVESSHRSPSNMPNPDLQLRSNRNAVSSDSLGLLPSATTPGQPRPMAQNSEGVPSPPRLCTLAWPAAVPMVRHISGVSTLRAFAIDSDGRPVVDTTGIGHTGLSGLNSHGRSANTAAGKSICLNGKECNPLELSDRLASRVRMDAI
jgi:hypothetical protein